MDNFDDDVDEYLNQNKIMDHEYFVVDMNDENMKIWNLLIDHLMMDLVLFQLMILMVVMVVVEVVEKLEVYLI